MSMSPILRLIIYSVCFYLWKMLNMEPGRMVVEFTTTYIQSVHIYYHCLTLWVRTPLMRGVLDKVCQRLAVCRWFSAGTPVSSTKKTDRPDITGNIVESGVKHHKPNLNMEAEIIIFQSSLGTIRGIIRLLLTRKGLFLFWLAVLNQPAQPFFPSRPLLRIWTLSNDLSDIGYILWRSYSWNSVHGVSEQ